EAWIPACGERLSPASIDGQTMSAGVLCRGSARLAVQAPRRAPVAGSPGPEGHPGPKPRPPGSLTRSRLQKTFPRQQSLDLFPVGSPRQVDGKRARSRRLALRSADDDGSLLVEGPGF